MYLQYSQKSVNAEPVGKPNPLTLIARCSMPLSLLILWSFAFLDLFPYVYNLISFFDDAINFKKMRAAGLVFYVSTSAAGIFTGF